MSIQRPWDEHEDKTLREMWGGGSSAREIANVLPWRTRNAVIGRANRLGIHRPDVAVIPRLEKADAPKVEKAKRASPSVAPVKPAPTLAFPSPVIVAPPPPIAPVAPPASTHVMTLWADWPKDRCRGPVYQGKIEPEMQIFCGKPVTEPPYCAECAKVLRLPPKKERTPAEERADHQRMLAMRQAKLKAASR